MITSVKNIGSGEYIINESVKVFNIDYSINADGLGDISGDIEWDGNNLTGSEAIELAEYFLNKAINNSLKEVNGQKE